MSIASPPPLDCRWRGHGGSGQTVILRMEMEVDAGGQTNSCETRKEEENSDGSPIGYSSPQIPMASPLL